MQKAFEHFDGVESVFRLWDHDNFNTCYLAAWDKQYDDQIMKAMYYAEQTNPFQDQYRDNEAAFEKDWRNDDFDTACAFALTPADIEVIEILKEAGGENV
ncbi:hypothetical protein D3C71_1983650 [compost metagenome]